MIQEANKAFGVAFWGLVFFLSYPKARHLSYLQYSAHSFPVDRYYEFSEK
jgi:hypothetical protein